MPQGQRASQTWVTAQSSASCRLNRETAREGGGVRQVGEAVVDFPPSKTLITRPSDRAEAFTVRSRESSGKGYASIPGVNM
jgi:hypothetical protein